MSEAVEVVTDYWSNELGFSVMRVPKAVVNAASRRISEKNGMRIVAVEERDYVAGRFLTEIWETTADEWRTHRGSTRCNSSDRKTGLLPTSTAVTKTAPGVMEGNHFKALRCVHRT